MKPRPTLKQFIDLPKGQTIATVQPYRKKYIDYPKWKFWRNVEVKYFLAIVTKEGRVYLVDPDIPSLEEAQNE